MILTDVRNYLRSCGRADLRDIAIHVDTDTVVVRGIVEKLIIKGLVERVVSNPACGTTCCSCDLATVDVYAWVGTA